MGSMSYYEKLPVSHYWNLDGARVHLACASALQPGRRTLLAVHGAGGSAWGWGELGLQLAEQFNFAAIELPGHGASEGPARADIGSMVRIVAAAAERLQSGAGTPPPIVMGHSMGGAISIELALSGAAELSGLVLVATGARLKVQSAIIDGIERDWEASCRSEEGFGPGAPAALKTAYAVNRIQGSPQVAASDFRACNVFDRMADLPKITLPTLVFGGGKDLLTPEKYARYLSERIPAATLVLLENAGHMLPIEEPQALAAALEKHFPQAPPVASRATK